MVRSDGPEIPHSLDDVYTPERAALLYDMQVSILRQIDDGATAACLPCAV
jgi:hypothetical protein